MHSAEQLRYSSSIVLCSSGTFMSLVRNLKSRPGQEKSIVQAEKSWCKWWKLSSLPVHLLHDARRHLKCTCSWHWCHCLSLISLHSDLLSSYHGQFTWGAGKERPEDATVVRCKFTADIEHFVLAHFEVELFRKKYRKRSEENEEDKIYVYIKKNRQII